jgi:hypothetical protein
LALLGQESQDFRKLRFLWQTCRTEPPLASNEGNRDKEPQETMQGPRSQGFAQIDTRCNQTYQEVEFATFIGQLTLYLAGFSGELGY